MLLDLCGKIGNALVPGTSFAGNSGKVGAERHEPSVRFVNDGFDFFGHGGIWVGVGGGGWGWVFLAYLQQLRAIESPRY